MDNQAALVLGVWAFACMTAISNRIAGWFMILAFVFAIFVSFSMIPSPTVSGIKFF